MILMMKMHKGDLFDKRNLELINTSWANQTVDAVVNATNDGLWTGGGMCGVILVKPEEQN